MLINILAFLLAIFILVTIHELGHFWVARRLGIKVVRFSIGFGKPIWRYQAKSGTEFAIGFLPLGGYVKLLDESEGHVAAADLPYAFNRQPLWKRILVVLAGVVMNLVLAIALFWVVLTVGMTQLKPVVGQVIPGSIAAEAGVLPGRQVVSLNQRKVRDWPQVMLRLVENIGDKGAMSMTTATALGQLTTHQLMINHWRLNPLKPDLLKSLGLVPFRPSVPAIIHEVSRHSPAARAGLETGDRVIAVDGQSVATWAEFVAIIQKQPNQQVSLTVLHAGQQRTVNVKTQSKFGRHWQRVGFIGVKSLPIEWPADQRLLVKYSPLNAISPALGQTWTYVRFNAIVLVKLITGKLSLQGLGGPIAIFQLAQQAFKQGAMIYINFLAILSAILAFINILPIPGLDGGHLLFYIIEAIRRKPLSPAAQGLGMRLGLILLVVILFQSTINDLMRIF